MAKFQANIKGSFKKVVKIINDSVSKSPIAMKLVDESCFILNDMSVNIKVYDKYFAKNGNRASLSITIAALGEDIFISAIAAGGGSGSFYSLSLGAEDDMVYVVEDTITRVFRPKK